MANKDNNYLLNRAGRTAVVHDVPIANVQKNTPQQPKETRKEIQQELQPHAIVVPRFNKLYSNLMTDQNIGQVVDGWSSGTITASNTSSVTVPLTINKNSPIRISQWPGSVMIYLVVSDVTLSAQSPDNGIIQMAINGNSGAQMIVGTSQINSGIDESPRLIFPNPLTDSQYDQVQSFPFGSLTVTLYNATAPNVCVYGINWSYAYLLAATQGYEVKKYEL